MHNLFGDTHAVDVEIDSQGNIRVTAVETGDRVKDLLEYVHISPERLEQSYNEQIRQLDADTGLKQALSAELRQALHGYCYLMAND